MKTLENIMGCYGKTYRKHRRCRACAYRKWCRSAADKPPKEKPMELLSNAYIAQGQNPAIPGDELDFDTPQYSQKELLEVIVFMLAIDDQTLNMLEEKINNPEITFSDIARKRGLTRQAIHKFITKKCQKIPELKEVFIKRVTPREEPAPTSTKQNRAA